MRGGTCPLLAASLDFQLLHVDVRVLLRVDGWPQSGGDCMAESYTGGKKEVLNSSIYKFGEENRKAYKIMQHARPESRCSLRLAQACE